MRHVQSLYLKNIVRRLQSRPLITELQHTFADLYSTLQVSSYHRFAPVLAKFYANLKSFHLIYKNRFSRPAFLMRGCRYLCWKLRFAVISGLLFLYILDEILQYYRLSGHSCSSVFLESMLVWV